MPIYEYRCGACGQEHEALQKVSEPPLTKCPACGKPKLKKLLSAAGFQLKGSGWYATDFKGGSKKSDASKDEASKDTAEAKKDAGSKDESKPKQESKAKEESKSDAPASGSGATTA
jgi:putative FmdB family regulatory protein